MNPQHNNQHLKKPPPYIYVKTDNPKTSYGKSGNLRISAAQSHTQIDLLQVKVDCLIDKMEHAVTWTAAYLRHGDTDSAIHELQSVQETTTHSKMSIHRSAKLRQQLH